MKFTAASFLLYWCPRQDSNPHGFPRLDLNQLRLPVTPLGHEKMAPRPGFGPGVCRLTVCRITVMLPGNENGRPGGASTRKSRALNSMPMAIRLLVHSWWELRDLNPYGFLRLILNQLRLPFRQAPKSKSEMCYYAKNAHRPHKRADPLTGCPPTENGVRAAIHIALSQTHPKPVSSLPSAIRLMGLAFRLRLYVSARLSHSAARRAVTP